jgi:hypothetical protein
LNLTDDDNPIDEISRDLPRRAADARDEQLDLRHPRPSPADSSLRSTHPAGCALRRISRNLST